MLGLKGYNMVSHFRMYYVEWILKSGLTGKPGRKRSSGLEISGYPQSQSWMYCGWKMPGQKSKVTYGSGNPQWREKLIVMQE